MRTILRLLLDQRDYRLLVVAGLVSRLGDYLLSVGLMDTVCPPSTVFAAYNEITADKDISIHPFTGHVVPTAHVERQLRHLRDFLR